MATRRQDIARVAARVIAAEGLERASLREIAGQMGVTIGTLTHQFRNREDLLRTTFETTVHAIRDRAAGSARGKRGAALLTALVAEGLPTSDTRRVETAVWLAFAMSAVTNDDHARLYMRHYREWEDALTAAVAGLEAVPVREARDAARLLIAVTDGIAMRALADRDLSQSEQERLLAEAIGVIVGPGVA